MSYLSLFITWIKMNGSDLTGSAWWDAFFDALVGVEKWFLALSWWIFGVAIVIAIVVIILSVLGKSESGFMSGLTCGCTALFLITLPLWEYLTLYLARGMAGAFTPQGPTSESFWISLILYILLGTG